MKIPSGWKWFQVKEITLNIQYGYTESSSSDNVGPKFLRITDIQNNQVDWENVPYCTIGDEAKQKYLLEDGDLVFARTGATVGKSFLIKGSIPEAVYASYLIRLRFPKETFDKYVWYFFQSPYYWNQIIDKKVGIGQPNVNGTTLGRMNIIICPLPEQHRIVAKIEELFSSLDKSIENLKTAKQQLKVYRQAVLKWAFEGRLTNENVVDGKMPEGWRKVKLGTVIEQPKYGTSKKCDYDLNGKGVLRIPNISDGFIDDSDLKYAEFNEEEIEKIKLKDGDLLTIRSNGSVDLVGKCALINKKDQDYLFAGYLIRLRPLKENILSKYLLHVLSSSELRLQIETKAKSTSGVNNINSEELKNLIIPICSIAEQQTIVSEIESRLSVCDKIEVSIEQSLQQAESLRQSILKKAFEGKLVPQDPNDEPASVLLERINSKRERVKDESPRLHKARKARIKKAES